MGISGKGLAVCVFFSLCAGSCNLVIGLEKKPLPEKPIVRCATSADCDDDHGCTQDLCALPEGTCNYYVLPAGTVCREKLAENICDIGSEYCDGTSYDCPVDTLQPATMECRASAGQCDEPENCDGSHPECPVDVFSSTDKVCDDADDCTYGDMCDGEGACAGINGLHDVELVSIGPWGLSTCALLTTDEVKCWGNNNYGQLGDGTSGVHRQLPVSVGSLPEGVQVTVFSNGGRHACAVLGTGRIMCWGLGDTGQLGNGMEGPDYESHVPVEVTGTPDGWNLVSGGYLHNCAIQEDDAVYCWGKNESGQLGNGTYDNAAEPVQVTGLAAAAGITAGSYHTCAIDLSGSLTCWGRNDNGQLGNPGAGDPSPSPVSVQGISSRVLKVVCGTLHTCALLENGGVMCWGTNDYGQLGVGEGPGSSLPVEVADLPATARDISASFEHTCAILEGGAVMCWGHNDEGQVGDGTMGGFKFRPVGVAGLPSGAVEVATGSFHTCVRLENATIWCWGANNYGQLGTGTMDRSLRPMEVHCD